MLPKRSDVLAGWKSHDMECFLLKEEMSAVLHLAVKTSDELPRSEILK